MTRKNGIVLGRGVSGRSIVCDLDVLIRTRMLIQASSGGGKSWTIRRLLEQTHGKVQHLVLDPEGEFSTLRERFDYVLVGQGGDVSADYRHAGLLARRLLELGASAILDLYELKPSERRHYVKVFLDALINLPKNLWHPCFVLVDEAHTFAPEKGESEATDAVIELATRGRKRGYCAVLGTQRLSKLHKDATAELRNRLIGMTTEDIDRKRAGEELGLREKDQILALRALEPGDFHAFGPAISPEIIKVRIGEVATSHPDIGRKAPPPPPAREKVRTILSKLADLPKEAEEEARTVESLRRQLQERDRELRALRHATPETVQPKIERVDVPVLKDAHIARLEKVVGTLHTLAGDVAVEAKSIRVALEANRTSTRVVPPKPSSEARLSVETRLSVASRTPHTEKLPKAERSILTVLAQHINTGRTVTQVALLTGYAVDGGGFRNALGTLRTAGFIDGRGDLRITEAGLEALGSWEPLPSPGPDLLRYWQSRLGRAERLILDAVSDAYPGAVTIEEVASQAGYAADGGGFRNALGRLRTLELVSGRGEVKISDTLMEA